MSALSTFATVYYACWCVASLVAIVGAIVAAWRDRKNDDHHPWR